MTTGVSHVPRPKRRPSRAISWIVAILAVVFVLAPIVVGFYTDWLWFGEVDYRSVFGRTIVARLVLFVCFGLIAGGITWVSCWLTWRNRPRQVEIAEPGSPVEQYRAMMERSVKLLLIGMPVIVALSVGFYGQGTWRTAMLFLNRQSFGQTDAQFGYDLGFYAFILPFLRLSVASLAMLLLLAFVITLVGHYLLGSIRIGNQAAGIKGSVSRAARIQLAIIAGLWMLLKVFTYWLDRFDLLTGNHDVFWGASYTDINAQLPARIILMIIALVVAFAFFSAIVLKDLRVPALATVLMVVSSLMIGTAWPLIMERFSVNPNRVAKESEYIARNIAATREAYGLTDDKVTYIDNWGAADISDAEVSADGATLSNIRLLDPDILAPTFTQQEQLRNFYGFPETLAMDRYEVDGQMRDFVVAARELDPNALQDNQTSWINRHTVYTHGNGFIAAQANKVDEVARDVGSTRGGYPVYTVSDLQSQAAADDPNNEVAEKLGISVDQPRVYYGPVIASALDGADYAIVGDTGNGPVEYDTDTSNYTYEGQGGVDIGNWINRSAFALKYRELNMILSDRVGADSKILFDRDPRERVEKVAPWLTTDSATYPAVVDGRIKWIVDGYTTLSSLPYSTPTSLSDTTQDTQNPDGTNQRLINENVGYIRNSVKAVVDAYDGTVELYEFDEEDPVLKAWEGVFPGTVKPASEISDELREHFRYPEDLFKVQRQLLTRYHVDDPNVFYTNDSFWSVPSDPTATGDLENLSQPPYYVVASDEDGNPSFQLVTPYRGLNREFLAAHMSVSSDPEDYGHMTVRILPTDTQTLGPKQAQDAMMSSDQIASDRTLWQGTNDLQNGNLLTLPVGGGEILYVEPIYSQRANQQSAFPKLLRVLVSYKDKVGYAPSISEALQQVGIDPALAQNISVVEGDDGTSAQPRAQEGSSTSSSTSATTSAAPSAPASGEGVEAINEALRNLEEARNGSFEDYGRALDQLDTAVKKYQQSQ